MSKSGGVFQIDDVTRTMSKGGGGAPGVPPIQVQTPPTWLAGYGPGLCLGGYNPPTVTPLGSAMGGGVLDRWCGPLVDTIVMSEHQRKGPQKSPTKLPVVKAVENIIG